MHSVDTLIRSSGFPSLLARPHGHQPPEGPQPLLVACGCVPRVRLLQFGESETIVGGCQVAIPPLTYRFRWELTWTYCPTTPGAAHQMFLYSSPLVSQPEATTHPPPRACSHANSSNLRPGGRRIPCSCGSSLALISSFVTNLPVICGSEYLVFCDRNKSKRSCCCAVRSASVRAARL